MNAVEERTNMPELRFSEFEGEWNAKTIGQLASVYDGTHQTPKYVPSGIPFYSVEHLTANNFSNTRFISKDVFEKENKRVKLERNDILMTRIGDISTCKIIDWDVQASFYVSLALIKQDEKYNSQFLNQLIKTAFFQRELHKRTIHVAFPRKINLGEISFCNVLLPEDPEHIEQKKIAAFLGTVDEKVSKLRRKQELLTDYKCGIMQQIFFQQIRFKADDGSDFPDWEEHKLEKFLIPFTERVSADTILPIFSSSREGLKPQSEYFANRELDNTGEYGVVPRGYFTYRHMSDDITFKFNINNVEDKIAVSKEYPVFSTQNMDNRFLLYYLNFGTDFKRFAAIQKVGGTRTRLYFRKLAAWKTLLPHPTEQKKIANFLSAIDIKVSAVSDQITQMEAFKKGLLQQMFV